MKEKLKKLFAYYAPYKMTIVCYVKITEYLKYYKQY